MPPTAPGSAPSCTLMHFLQDSSSLLHRRTSFLLHLAEEPAGASLAPAGLLAGALPPLLPPAHLGAGASRAAAKPGALATV